MRTYYMSFTILGAVIMLFLVMDPFGNIPLFISALRKVPPERRTFVLIRELAIALAIMVGFMFLGKQLLKFLGIAEYSLSIAGGLVLLMIAFDLVFDAMHDETKPSPKEEEPFIVPLAIPLVAGPGSLSVTLLLAAQSPGKSAMLAVILITSIANMLVLLMSFPISNLLGRRGILAIERLSGMILVLLSVNMIMDGIAAFMSTRGL